MNNKKRILFILLVMIIVSSTLPIFARVTNPGVGTVNGQIKNKADNIWATISFVTQIVSVGCVVFAGLRYMFASADQKADIKQGLSYLVIGAVLVFGAVSIIKLISGTVNTFM